MRIALLMILWLAATPSAFAQQIMDGSGEGLGVDVKKIVIDYIIGGAKDPFSTQLARLRRSEKDPNTICGLVNVKGPNGLYDGFTPVVITAGEIVDPLKSDACN